MDELDEQFGDTPRRDTPAMTPKGAEIAATLKETFFAYTNRLPRSQQATLGPSEIGTPCDRRLAMSLLQVEPVNPGGDGWAAFVGTCVHAGLADMRRWANAGTGRYAPELALAFPSAHVPMGTGDVLDRVMCLFADDKLMGSSSLSKLRHNGPPQHYRVQVHVYGYGATLRGEQIDTVAIIGWPREAASLKGLFVWEEPYQEQIALDALARVDRIAETVKRVEHRVSAASLFPIADDCKFCSWHHAGGAKAGGCDGKR